LIFSIVRCWVIKTHPIIKTMKRLTHEWDPSKGERARIRRFRPHACVAAASQLAFEPFSASRPWQSWPT